MSVGVIQIGQCGNQIGFNIFDNLINEMKNSSECLTQMISDTYFTISDSNKITANSILIDMEAKVIEKCLKKSKLNGWYYDNNNIIHKQSGSGNNWANGFFYHGPTIENTFVETISSFSEKFDYLDSIILINSLAGGTGSGLGSYITILLKDYFPEINLLNIAIWPHNSGEVVVNSYNTLLSISENYKVSDLMTIINNQDIYDICRDIYNYKKIGFENLNYVISRNIINMMIPPLGDDVNLKSKPYQINTFISELIYFLGINPKLKFSRIISTPEIPLENLKYTNNTWLSLTKRGAQMMKNYSNESKVDWSKNQTVSNNSVISIYRGKSLSSIPEDDNMIIQCCKDNNTKLKEYKDINSINSYEKHLTLLTNSNYYCQAIKKTLQKAYEMYEYNAFIHQYEKYNLQKDDFVEAFSFCEQIIYDYTHI
jgi:tubulin delta